MSKKKLIKIVLQIIVYSLVAVFIYLTLKDNISEIKEYRILSPFYLGMSILVFSVHVMINAFAWVCIMKASKEKVSTVNSLNVYISTYIVRYIPGNVVAIAARAIENKQHGVRMLKSLWGWFVENLSFLLIGGSFSMLVFTRLFNEISGIKWVMLIFLAVGVGLFLKYEIFGKYINKLLKKKFPKYISKEAEVLELSYKNKLILLGIYVILRKKKHG